MGENKEKMNVKSKKYMNKIIPIKPVIKKLEPNTEIIKNLKAVFSSQKIKEELKTAVSKLEADDALPSQNHMHVIRPANSKAKLKLPSESVKETLRTSILHRNANIQIDDKQKIQNNSPAKSSTQTINSKITTSNLGVTVNNNKTNILNISLQKPKPSINFNSTTHVPTLKQKKIVNLKIESQKPHSTKVVQSDILNNKIKESKIKSSNSSILKSISDAKCDFKVTADGNLAANEIHKINPSSKTPQINITGANNCITNSQKDRNSSVEAQSTTPVIPSFENLSAHLHDKRKLDNVSKKNSDNSQYIKTLINTENYESNSDVTHRKKTTLNTSLNIRNTKYQKTKKNIISEEDIVTQQILANSNNFTIEENSCDLKIDRDPLSGVINYKVNMSNIKNLKPATYVVHDIKIQKASVSIEGKQTGNYKADILDKRISAEKNTNVKILEKNSIFKLPETPPQNKPDDINFQNLLLINEIEEYNNQNNIIFNNQSIISLPLNSESPERNNSGCLPKLIQDLDSNNIFKQKPNVYSSKIIEHVDSNLILKQKSLADFDTLNLSNPLNITQPIEINSKLSDNESTFSQEVAADAVDFLCNLDNNFISNEEDDMSETSSCIDDSEILRPEDFLQNFSKSFVKEEEENENLKVIPINTSNTETLIDDISKNLTENFFKPNTVPSRLPPKVIENKILSNEEKINLKLCLGDIVQIENIDEVTPAIINIDEKKTQTEVVQNAKANILDDIKYELIVENAITDSSLQLNIPIEFSEATEFDNSCLKTAQEIFENKKLGELDLLNDSKTDKIIMKDSKKADNIIKDFQTEKIFENAKDINEEQSLLFSDIDYENFINKLNGNVINTKRSNLSNNVLHEIEPPLSVNENEVLNSVQLETNLNSTLSQTSKPKTVQISSRRPRLRGGKINLVQRRKTSTTTNKNANVSNLPNNEENPAISPHSVNNYEIPKDENLKTEILDNNVLVSQENNNKANFLDVQANDKQNNSVENLIDKIIINQATEETDDEIYSMEIDAATEIVTSSNSHDVFSNTNEIKKNSNNLINSIEYSDVYNDDINIFETNNIEDLSNGSDLTNKSDFNGFDLSLVKDEEYTCSQVYNTIEQIVKKLNQSKLSPNITINESSVETTKCFENDVSNVVNEDVVNNETESNRITDASHIILANNTTHNINEISNLSQLNNDNLIDESQKKSNDIQNLICNKNISTTSQNFVKKRPRNFQSDSDSCGEDCVPLKKRHIRNIYSSSSASESEKLRKENKIIILDKREYFSSRKDSETSTTSDHYQSVAELQISNIEITNHLETEIETSDQIQNYSKLTEDQDLKDYSKIENSSNEEKKLFSSSENKKNEILVPINAENLNKKIIKRPRKSKPIKISNNQNENEKEDDSKILPGKNLEIESNSLDKSSFTKSDKKYKTSKTSKLTKISQVKEPSSKEVESKILEKNLTPIKKDNIDELSTNEISICSSTPIATEKLNKTQNPKTKKFFNVENEQDLENNTSVTKDADVEKENSKSKQPVIDNFPESGPNQLISEINEKSNEINDSVVLKKKRGRKPKNALAETDNSKIAPKSTNSKKIISDSFEKLYIKLSNIRDRQNRKSIKVNSTILRKLHPNLLIVTDRCQIDSFNVNDVSLPSCGDDEIICGLCKQTVLKQATEWSYHLSCHYGVGWVEGKEDIDVTQYNLVLSVMINFMKVTKCEMFKCRMCATEFRSALGMLSHIVGCGLTEDEKRNETCVPCKDCNNYFHYLALSKHMKSCLYTSNNNDLKESSENEIEKTCNSENVNESKESDFLSNTGRLKRKSTVKAESKFKEIDTYFKSNDKLDATHFMKTSYTLRGYIFKLWKQKIESGEKVKCCGDTCELFFEDMNLLKEHLKICDKVARIFYSCLLCKFKDVDATVVEKHIYSKHQQSLKNVNLDDSCSEVEFSKKDLSESSDECSSGVDENEISDIEPDLEDIDENSKNKSKKQINNISKIENNKSYIVNRPKTFFSNKRNSFLNTSQNATNWTNFFTKNNFSSEALFPCCLPNFKPCNDLNPSDYKPVNNLSMKFSFSNINTNSYFGSSKPDKLLELDCFKSLENNVELLLFIGGPITTLEWIPLPDFISCKIQYLAISYKCNYNNFTRVLNLKSHNKTLILIYKLENLKNDFSQISYCDFSKIKNKLEYCIACDNGPIHDMKFLPSGGYDTSINRLGLLAVANTEGNVNIYSLPIQIPENCCDTINDSLNIIQLTPVMRLTLNFGFENNNDIKQKKNHYFVQCHRIAWSMAKGHNILATGYVNGSVALWNIDPECNLNCFKNDDGNELLNFTPLSYFRVSDKYISSIDFHYDHKEPRWLMAASHNRTLRIFDIEDISHPTILLDEVAKSLITSATWPIIWETLISSVSSDLCLAAPVTISPMQLGYVRRRCARIPSGVTCLDYNPWNNVCIIGTETGDITLELRSEYNLDCSLKRYLDTKIFTYTDLIRLDGNQHPIKSIILKNTECQEQNKKNNNDQINCQSTSTPLKFFDKDYRSKYGLVFGPMNFSKNEKIIHSENRLPPIDLNYYVRVNCVACNKNFNGSNFYTVGYENGFVRILYKLLPKI